MRETPFFIGSLFLLLSGVPTQTAWAQAPKYKLVFYQDGKVAATAKGHNAHAERTRLDAPGLLCFIEGGTTEYRMSCTLTETESTTYKATSSCREEDIQSLMWLHKGHKYLLVWYCEYQLFL